MKTPVAENPRIGIGVRHGELRTGKQTLNYNLWRTRRAMPQPANLG